MDSRLLSNHPQKKEVILGYLNGHSIVTGSFKEEESRRRGYEEQSFGAVMPLAVKAEEGATNQGP